jgi:hypothetical protein
MTINLKADDVLTWIFWVLDMIAAVAFALIFVAVVLRYWSVSSPFLPAPEAVQLAYYAGAWWLSLMARKLAR